MVFVHISRYDMVSTPVGRAKFRYQKKINLQHRNTKIVKLGLQMTKLKVSGEIFSRLGNVTKLKD